MSTVTGRMWGWNSDADGIVRMKEGAGEAGRPAALATTYPGAFNTNGPVFCRSSRWIPLPAGLCCAVDDRYTLLTNTVALFLSRSRVCFGILFGKGCLVKEDVPWLTTHTQRKSDTAGG
jgi:hypothetical protein